MGHNGQPVNAYVCVIDVGSKNNCIEKAPATGGTMGVPKMAIHIIGWLVDCKDTEGNIFGMIQSDPEAFTVEQDTYE